MDDEDSKVRRNLIVVSVLMILVWWLGAPLDKVSEKFFGVAPSGPAFEWRVWFAAMVALSYFALRFRFCDNHQEALDVLLKESDQIEGRVLKRWISLEIWLYMRFGIVPRFMGEPFKKLIESAVKVTDYAQYQAPGQAEKVSAIQVRSAHLGLWTSGRFIPSRGKYQARLMVRTRRTDGVERENDETINFLFGRLRRVILWAIARAWLLGYSRTGPGLLVPWALAAGAGLVGIYKLAVSW